jgi:hypothetical protein
MNRGRVGEERGGKETDGCPLTIAATAALANSEEGMVMECEVSDEDFVWSSR